MLSNSIAEEISGIPKVVDGDTIHINNYKFRLEGIDAPEMRQQCKKESFKISFLIYSFLSFFCGLGKRNISERGMMNRKNIDVI